MTLGRFSKYEVFSLHESVKLPEVYQFVVCPKREEPMKKGDTLRRVGQYPS